jgi:iron complex transport system permease protein
MFVKKQPLNNNSHINSRLILVFVVSVIILLTSFAYSLVAFSQFSLHLKDLAAVFSDYDSTKVTHQIITELRFPRAIVAALAGAAMACAGLLMQGITRNSLASPSVFGVSGGAAFAFAFASTGLWPWLTNVPVLFVTMLGAFSAGGAVFFLGGLHNTRVNPIRVVLAGVAINYLCISMTRAAVIYADENAFGVLNWLIGSVSNTSFVDVNTMLPGSIIGIAIAVSLSHKLNLLHLGEELANSLGSNAKIVRLWLCAAVVLLISSAVSVAGPIGFIGLIIPHICRALIGRDHRFLVPLCVILGAGLLLCADILSRVIRFPDDSPVGIITTLIGALFFLMLTLKQVKSTS